jgi:hypothetical protein
LQKDAVLDGLASGLGVDDLGSFRYVLTWHWVVNLWGYGLGQVVETGQYAGPKSGRPFLPTLSATLYAGIG